MTTALPVAHEAATTDPSASPTAITVAWLVRLRWGAVAAQTVTVLVAVYGLGLDLRIWPMAGLIGATVLSNAALALRVRRGAEIPSRAIIGILAGDVIVLTGLLYCSGGPSNPFSVIYLVHVTLAALVLGVRWASAIVALAAVLYAALFFSHTPVGALDHAHHHSGHGARSTFSVHLQGMWIAFTVAAALIAYFVARIAGALRERESELAKARAAAARAERLASLTTLAAGAAHELGTPLGTIAVAAKELERSIGANIDEARADARLIRAEVERCRMIVQRMSAGAGQTMGELPRRLTAAQALAGCLERLPPGPLETIDEAGDAALACPFDGLVQVLASLVENARSATRARGGRVVLRAVSTPERVRFVVDDDGDGVDPSVLARLGEPFFTTKPPGEGMGLGLFLARTFAERWGGTFGIQPRAGGGATATIELPREESRG